MIKSKLIQLLKKLDSQEKELLKKWILSPAHNSHQDIQNLFLYLFSKRNFSSYTTDRYRVYEHIFGKQNYSDKKLKHLMRSAVQKIESFIEFSMQVQDEFSAKKNLISFLQQQQLDKYAQQHIQKVQKKLRSTVQKNSHYFYQQYQLEQLVFEQESTTTRLRTTNLQAIFDNHYISFVLETLRHACTAITHQNLQNVNYTIPLLAQILKEIAAGQYQEIPAVQLYYYSYMTLSRSDQTNYFEQLKLLLLEHSTVLAHKELQSIYIIAINACIWQLNNGQEQYIKALFELYKYGLTHQTLISNNQLSRFAYKNIATTAIRLQEYKWTLDFIKNYTSFLAVEYQKNYADYAKAKLAFAQGEYDTTLQLISQVEFDDLFLNMSAKIMLLKIYYEQQYFDSLDALITSMRRFVQRKSFTYQKKVYENIINLTEKLLKLKPSKTTKTALQKEIENTNPLTERPWLLAQLDKLK